jgi:hypothetical protein
MGRHANQIHLELCSSLAESGGWFVFVEHLDFRENAARFSFPRDQGAQPRPTVLKLAGVSHYLHFLHGLSAHASKGRRDE